MLSDASFLDLACDPLGAVWTCESDAGFDDYLRAEGWPDVHQRNAIQRKIGDPELVLWRGSSGESYWTIGRNADASETQACGLVAPIGFETTSKLSGKKYILRRTSSLEGSTKRTLKITTHPHNEPEKAAYIKRTIDEADPAVMHTVCWSDQHDAVRTLRHRRAAGAVLVGRAARAGE